MDKKWKQGDPVILKSGGPDMTVKQYSEQHGTEGQVICSWFKDDEIMRDYFGENEIESNEE